MPRRDGTGPMGGGSKTGLGLGNCTTEVASNKNNFRGPGRGLGNIATGRGSVRGCGKGKGNGFGRCFNRIDDKVEDVNLR